MSLFTLPKQVAVDSSGQPYPGALLYFYAAGGLTYQAVYTDSALSVAHSQPVVADANGVFAAIYLKPDSAADYRIQLKDADGVLLYDQDNVPKSGWPTQAQIGAIFYPETAAETAAAVTPTYYYYEPGDIRRYGAVGDDSTDCTTAITNAIAQAAVGTGAAVYVPQGTFKMISAIAVLDNVTIYGEGYSSILKQVTASTSNFTIATSNVTISGVHFQGGTDVSTTGRVALNAADKITVEDCFFTNHAGWGVHSDGASSEVRVSGCYFSDWASPTTGASAVNVYNNGTRFTITDNIILGGSSSSSTGAFFGISVLRSSGAGTFNQFVISNNNIQGIREYGIVVYANTDTTTDVSITGNTVDYVYGSTANTSSGAGIYLLRPANTTVSGNTIGHTNISTAVISLAPGAIGVNAAYGKVAICGNTIHDTTMYGMYIVSGASTASFSITGNTINETAYAGIYLYLTSNATVSGNSFQNTATTANVAALYVVGASGTHTENFAVVGNEFLCSKATQIQFVYADDLTFVGNTVEQTATSGACVYLSTCDRAVVSGNVIKSDATSGGALQLVAVTAGRVSGNYLLCNHSADYYVTSGTCTGTLADESNLLSRADNSGTGSNVVLRVTASPAAGNYQIGDRAWDTDAASAAPMGWVCTAAGGPGTWTAMPNLA